MPPMVRPNSDITPQSITAASFRTVKKGYDPTEVRNYLASVASRVQQVQADAEAMEARARAALAKLHAAERTPDMPLVDEAETISRTLLLAQRTADETVERARRDAEQMMVEAEANARAAHADAWEEAHSEVEALRARRDFLAGDVEELERFLAAQRMRLGDVAERLMGFVAAPIEGLGLGGRPVLSGAEPAREVSTGSSVDDIIDVAEDAVEQLVLTETADPTPPSGTGLRFRDGV
jgi:DivIVA domain-containing protein